MSEAKSIILDLLSPRGERPMPVAAIVASSQLFGISDNNARVTMARMVQNGALVRSADGEYGLGPRAARRNRYVTTWSADPLLREWNGRWIAVHFERPFVARERHHALVALGLARLALAEQNLAVRPDNLGAAADQVYTELRTLGLTRPLVVMSSAQVDPATAVKWARDLWPATQLRTQYRRMARNLTAGTERLDTISFERALVESFTLGGKAIRMLALDPLLPSEIMAGHEREELRVAMRIYDRAGRALWKRFNAKFDRSMPPRLAPFRTASDLVSIQNEISPGAGR